MRQQIEDKKNKFNCDICGRYISIKDLESGKAARKMITPDSDFSYEEFETLCFVCKKDEI